MRHVITTLVTLVVCGAALGAGCKSDCEKLVDRTLACPAPLAVPDDPGPGGVGVVARAPTRAELAGVCAEDGVGDVVALLASCLDRPTCDAFNACVGDVQRVAFRDSLRSAAEGRDWATLAIGCRVAPKAYGPDEETDRICLTAADEAAAALGERARAARDGAGTPPDWDETSALRYFAGRQGPEALAAADLLGREVEALEDLARARAAWAPWKRGERPTVLLGEDGLAFDCSGAVRQLAAIDSPWARERVAEIRRECRPPAPPEVPVEVLHDAPTP